MIIQFKNKEDYISNQDFRNIKEPNRPTKR